MNLEQFAQNLANFIVGPFGRSMCVFAIAATAIAATMDFHGASWNHVFRVVVVCAFVFSAGYIVTTWLGA